jgi:predicted transcriptional regulator
MTRKRIPKPTGAELAILRVLWQQGASTVRQVQEALKAERGTGYTTTLKLMQIMLEKGLLKRDDSAHAHVYEAAVTRGKTQKQLVSDLLDQVFEGSAQQLVMQALSSRKSSAKELAAIRKLIDQLEGDQS